MALPVSQAILQGREQEAGSVRAAGARDRATGHRSLVCGLVCFGSSALERIVQRSARRERVRHILRSSSLAPQRCRPRRKPGRLERVAVSRTTIEIELAESAAGDDQNRVLIIPWTPPSPQRRREIIQGAGERPSTMRPMRTKARAILIDALRDAHHWLDDLTRSPNQTIEALAAREGKTERWIRRTLSLAFLCPTLVRAAIDGRLPRGYGVKRLMDLPMDWPQQWAALGLKAPAEG